MTDCARSPTNTHRCPCYHAGLWHSTTAERCPCRLDHANDNATSMPDSPFNHSLAHSLTRYVCLCCTPQRHATRHNATQRSADWLLATRPSPRARTTHLHQCQQQPQPYSSRCHTHRRDCADRTPSTLHYHSLMYHTDHTKQKQVATVMLATARIAAARHSNR